MNNVWQTEPKDPGYHWLVIWQFGNKDRGQPILVEVGPDLDTCHVIASQTSFLFSEATDKNFLYLVMPLIVPAAPAVS